MNFGRIAASITRLSQFGRVLTVLLLLVGGAARPALAHAVLVQADPPPNSHIQQAPSAITLTFDERLQQELYSIRIFDGQGRQVKTGAAVMSRDRRQVMLALPKLKPDVYTVDYHIISADGHPIEAAFTLAVGKSEQDVPLGAAVAGTSQTMRHGGMVNWVEQLLDYTSLLVLSGWLLWRRLQPLPSGSGGAEIYARWFRIVRRTYGVILLGGGIVQLIDQLDGLAWQQTGQALLHTTSGICWLVSLASTALAWRMLDRSKAVSVLWVLLQLAAESVNGHAFSADWRWLAVAFDFVHLCAAALWAGGLSLLLLLWRAEPEWCRGFLPRFSRLALISIAVLAATGAGQAWLIDHQWDYLLHAAWGWLLIGKIGLLGGVIATAAGIRRSWRRGDEPGMKRLILQDAALLLGILGLTAGLTHAFDKPRNDPLYWDQTLNGVREITAVSPNNPGADNAFRVQIEMPGKQAPRQVQLTAKAIRLPGAGAITIPLQFQGTSAAGTAVYAANGPFLPVGGSWVLTLNVVDADLNDTQFVKHIRLFDVKSSSH